MGPCTICGGPTTFAGACVYGHHRGGLPVAKYDESQRAPECKISGEVIGFRAWRMRSVFSEVALTAAGMSGHAWRAGANEAVCLQLNAHKAPAAHCSCGLYAWHDPQVPLQQGLDPNALMVVGVVRGWGRMEIHSDGWRAQFAQAVSLALPEHLRLLHPQAADQLRKLARIHSARLVAMDQLADAGREFGDPVPKNLRPAVVQPTGRPIPFTSGQFAAAMATGGLIANPSSATPPSPPAAPIAPPRAAPITIRPAPEPKRLSHGRKLLMGIGLYVATYSSLRLAEVNPWWLAIVAALCAQMLLPNVVYRVVLRLRCSRRSWKRRDQSIHRSLRTRQDHGLQTDDRCPDCGWRLGVPS